LKLKIGKQNLLKQNLLRLFGEDDFILMEDGDVSIANFADSKICLSKICL